MKYTTIPGLNKKVSKIVMGLSNDIMNNGYDNDDNLTYAFNNGINTFDCARVYGNGKSEESFGRWLVRQRRDQVVVVTKCCHPNIFGFSRVNKKEALKDIEASLRALKTSYVDVLLLHRDNKKVPVSTIVDFMNDIIKLGYTKTIGVSNWSIERIKEANEYAKENNLVPFTVSSPNYCLARLVNFVFPGEASYISSNESEEYNYYKENDIRVLAYSALGNGFLSGKYKADEIEDGTKLPKLTKALFYSKDNIERLRRAEEVAKEVNSSVSIVSLAYLLNQELEVCPIISATSYKHIGENLGALDLNIKDKLDYLDLKDLKEEKSKEEIKEEEPKEEETSEV